jgi:hypothetical protein
MRNENLDTVSILQEFIENSSTYICEDVNIGIGWPFFYQISLWDYFSQAAVETLNCTGNPFDDKLIVGTLTGSEENQIIHDSFVAPLKRNPYNVSL